MINNQQQILNPNESTTASTTITTPTNSNSTTNQPTINQLQQSVSDISTLSSTTNSDS